MNDDAIFGNTLRGRVGIISFSLVISFPGLATIFAHETRLQEKKRTKMSLASVFGSDLNWILRDDIGYNAFLSLSLSHG